MKQNNTIPIKIQKSWKHMTPRYTTTFNAGDVVPFFNKLIQPNDYIDMGAESITNMSIPNYATMDILYQDIAFFESPIKLVFDDWEKFYGEDKNNPYIEDVEIFLPQLKCPENGWEIGTLADYMYMPVKQKCKDVCALPFRIFTLIVENYYRDEEREEHYLISKGSTDQTGTNGNNFYTDLQNGGKIPKACKLFDYFTGTKLQFQAGEGVKLPLGTTSPVLVGTEDIPNEYFTGAPLRLKRADGEDIEGNSPLYLYDDYVSNTGANSNPTGYFYGLAPANLYTDLSKASSVDLRTLKIALMTQQYLQNLEDGGTRYIEQIYKRWGIFANELELQVPQYLGGHRFQLNMTMIAGTAPGNAESGKYEFGSVTGVSNTRYSAKYFKKHFQQHGWLFGITTIRPLNTYQQGIERQHILKSLNDLYKPEMAFLGPEPVYNYEIYSDGTPDDDIMFGVRNYGDYLRYLPNKVSGQIRKNSNFSQDYKTYALYFNERPLNNVEFIKADESQVDKTLIDIEENGEKQNQFTFQIQLDIWIRQNLPANGNGSTTLRI